jgi:hypothetical protein
MAMKLIKTLSAASDYARCHAWLWWTVGGFAGAALCASRASLRDSIGDHAGIALLLLLPVLLVARLVVGADDAREKLRCGPSCRRS